VRTPSFKRWFGDWEKNARLRKLLKAKVVELTGYKGQYALDYKSALAWLEKQDGTLTIPDTGETIRIGKSGRRKVTSHSRESEAHLKSIASIQQMLRGATFIEEQENEKGDVGKYSRYRYYVAGVKIDGVDYTAKIVVGVAPDGSLYYDHGLTQIEKGALINSLPSLSRPVSAENQNSLDGVKDKKLLEILQEESASKVVDSNGEPQVMYHGSASAGEITVFDPKQSDDGRSLFAANYITSTTYLFNPTDRERKIKEAIRKKISVLYDRRFDAQLKFTRAALAFAGIPYNEVKSGYEVNKAEEAFLKTEEGKKLAAESDAEAKKIREYEKRALAYAEALRKGEIDIDLTVRPGSGESGTLAVFVNLRNPAVVDNKSHWKTVEYTSKDGWTAKGTRPVARAAQKDGFDGVIFEHIKDFGGSFRYDDPYKSLRPSRVIVAFSGYQIKSATDNDGSFSPDNPDIRYARGGYLDDGSISNRGWHALHEGKEPAATIALNLGVSVQGAEWGIYFLEKHDAIEREWHHVGKHFEKVDFYNGHYLYEVADKKASEITDADEAVAYAALVIMRTHAFDAKPKVNGHFSRESGDAHWEAMNAEGLKEADKRKNAAEDALEKAVDSGENITEALVEFENASVDYQKKHGAAVKAFLKKYGNEWTRERPQRGRAIGGNTEVRYSLNRDLAFPLAPISHRMDSAAVKRELSNNRPVPFAGTKIDIIAEHPELFLRIGNLARASGGRVIDAFAGAGTYTIGLGTLNALPRGSVLNEWAVSRYVMHRMLAKNPQGVAKATEDLIKRFAESKEIAEYKENLRRIRAGEKVTNYGAPLVKWFTDELRGKHGVQYVTGKGNNSVFGDADLIENETSAALYVVLQTLISSSHPVNFVFNAKGELVIQYGGRQLTSGGLTMRTGGEKGYFFKEHILKPETYTKKILAAGKIYQDAELDVRRGDGWALAETAQKGDVVFVDPAYLGVTSYGGKDNIDASDANNKEIAIERLANLINSANARGVSIIYTNEYTDKSHTKRGGMTQEEYAEVWTEALKRVESDKVSANFFNRGKTGSGKEGSKEKRADIVFASGDAAYLLKPSRVEIDLLKERYGFKTDAEAEQYAWEAKTSGLSEEQKAEADEWAEVRFHKEARDEDALKAEKAALEKEGDELAKEQDELDEIYRKQKGLNDEQNARYWEIVKRLGEIDTRLDEIDAALNLNPPTSGNAQPTPAPTSGNENSNGGENNAQPTAQPSAQPTPAPTARPTPSAPPTPQPPRFPDSRFGRQRRTLHEATENMRPQGNGITAEEYREYVSQAAVLLAAKMIQRGTRLNGFNERSEAFRFRNYKIFPPGYFFKKNKVRFCAHFS